MADKKDGSFELEVKENGKEVKRAFKITEATLQQQNEATKVYNRAFRDALESGALLRNKLEDYMRSQGMWDDEKQATLEGLQKEILDGEKKLAKGGIRLSAAKEAALEMSQKRAEIRMMLMEKNSLDASTAEGQADNARFTSLLAQCILKEDGRNRVFADIDSYEESASQPWAVQAASELANMLYDLDHDYDKNLKENQFLVNYGFANEDLQLTNSDGHLIDIDEDGVERLIDKEGRFIKYDDDGNAIYINRKGEEVDEDGKPKVAFQPFLDDKGKPVDVPVTEEETAEETSEETAESEEETPAPKKRGRPKKSEETV